MKLIIGGAYQGKRDFAITIEKISPAEIFDCESTTTEIDFSYPVINNIQLLFWAQQQQGLRSLDYLQANKDLLRGKTIICEDLSAGVVPIEEATRLWRETTGRCGVWLAREADEVFRVFCGIGTRIKP